MTDPTDSYDVTAEADQAHDEKWLADQVVALGVGRKYVAMGTEYVMCNPWENCAECGDYLTADVFVRDWRVAGGLIEECEKRGIDWIAVLCKMSENSANEANESIPRAIIEAIVAALT